MPRAHTPSWRRKANGQPYANVIASGKRTRPEFAKPDWTDAEVEIAFKDFCATVLPRLQQTAPDPRTISGLCDWYVETIMVSRGTTEGSRESSRVMLRRWVADLRSRGIVSAKDLQSQSDALDALTAARLRVAKPNTVRKELARLRAVLRAAVARKLIPQMPVTEWPWPKVSAPQYDDFNVGPQIRAMLEGMKGSDYEPIARFMAYQGCRPSDACSIRREHVYLDDKFAGVVEPKTGQLHLMALSEHALAVVRAELAKKTDSPYLFLTRKGTPMRPRIVSNKLDYTGRAWGITAKTFRQSVVSVLYDLGYDDATVASVTGHASPAIKRYRKLRRGLPHAAIAAYAEHLSSIDSVEAL